MKISRSGYAAYFGTYETELPEPRIWWDPETSELKVSAAAVPDFDTPARHNYVIAASLDEVGAVLEALVGAEASASSKQIAAALTPHVHALLKLVGVCCWPAMLEQLGTEQAPK